MYPESDFPLPLPQLALDPWPASDGVPLPQADDALRAEPRAQLEADDEAVEAQAEVQVGAGVRDEPQGALEKQNA